MVSQAPEVLLRLSARVRWWSAGTCARVGGREGVRSGIADGVEVVGSVLRRRVVVSRVARCVMSRVACVVRHLARLRSWRGSPSSMLGLLWSSVAQSVV